MKVVFQKLWEFKLEWDEDVPTDLQQKHTLWRNLLTLFKDLPFDRCYFRTGDTIKTTELHGFSDAAEDAYAAVAYLRATYESGPPTMVLVAAKTKVAPLKRLSIPRFFTHLLYCSSTQLCSHLCKTVSCISDLLVSPYITTWSLCLLFKV